MNLRYLILCAVILSGILAYLMIVPSCDFDGNGKRKYSVREDWHSDTLSPAALSATAYNVDRKATRAASSPTPTRHPDTITATAEVWATKAANSRNYSATRQAVRATEVAGINPNFLTSTVVARKSERYPTATPAPAGIVEPDANLMNVMTLAELAQWCFDANPDFVGNHRKSQSVEILEAWFLYLAEPANQSTPCLGIGTAILQIII